MLTEVFPTGTSTASKTLKNVKKRKIFKNMIDAFNYITDEQLTCLHLQLWNIIKVIIRLKLKNISNFLSNKLFQLRSSLAFSLSNQTVQKNKINGYDGLLCRIIVIFNIYFISYLSYIG